MGILKKLTHQEPFVARGNTKLEGRCTGKYPFFIVNMDDLDDIVKMPNKGGNYIKPTNKEREQILQTLKDKL